MIFIQPEQCVADEKIPYLCPPEVEQQRVPFALFPLAIACNFLGIYLVRVTPEAMFYQITNVIVFVLGLELTRQGVTELLR